MLKVCSCLFTTSNTTSNTSELQRLRSHRRRPMQRALATSTFMSGRGTSRRTGGTGEHMPGGRRSTGARDVLIRSGRRGWFGSRSEAPLGAPR